MESNSTETHNAQEKSPTPVAQGEGLSKFNVDSIYPNPVRQGLASSKVTDSKVVIDGEGGGQILRTVLVVLGVAVILSPILSTILSSLLGLMFNGKTSYFGNLDVFKLLELHFKLLPSSEALMTTTLIFLVVGAGIIARKHVARIALITLMAISMIASIVSTVATMQTVSQLSSMWSSATITGLQPSLGLGSSMTSYVVAELIIGLIISAGVIMFLIQPKVRSAFS